MSLKLPVAFADPDIGQSVRALTDELVYAIGRFADFEKVAPKLTIVLALVAISSARGGPPPNSTKVRQAERWTSFAIDADAYARGEAVTKVRVLAAGLVGAINQAPDKWLNADAKTSLAAAITDGSNLLLSEADRIRPHQRILAPTFLTLQGEDLNGFEFVADGDGPLYVNGQRARARVADSVVDMCGAIVSLTIAPDEGVPLDDLTTWLAGIRRDDF